MSAQPQRSFGQYFSRIGRLENAWGDALARPDSREALERLRALIPRFESQGKPAAQLWPRFQESALGDRFAHLLTEGHWQDLCSAGERLARAEIVDLSQTWWPLISASLKRNGAADRARAVTMLTDLYNSGLVSEEARLNAAISLAGLGAEDEAHIAVYVDVASRRTAPPDEIATMIGQILQVGFDDEDPSLRRAYRLAVKLSGKAQRPESEFALGIGALLLNQCPAAALAHFKAAAALAPQDSEALRGVLAAHLHAGDIGAVLAVGSTTTQLSPRCSELLRLCWMLAWLDAPCTLVEPENSADAPPESADTLAGIAPGRDMGPWRDYALGRSHLLEGEAQKARQFLAPLPAAGLVEPDVYYHAAWAQLLCQDAEGVRTSYHALMARPGSWALGCLLLDADPGLVMPQTILSEPAVYARGRLIAVAGARRELIEGGGAAKLVDRRALRIGGITGPDLFEALRTALGVAVACKDASELNSLIRQPLFARLPAAERLLWTALAVRPVDPERSRQMLWRSRSLGRSRAALLLAVDAIEDGRASEVRGVLRNSAGPKAQLLLAWADAHSGASEQAARRFEGLPGRGGGHADYALGLLALRDGAEASAFGRAEEARSDADRAVSLFVAATDRAPDRFDTGSLSRAARSLAASDAQPASPRTWSTRLVNLAYLVRDPEGVTSQLLQDVADWIEAEPDYGAALEPRFRPALAEAVLRTCLLATDAAVCEQAAEVLARFAERFPEPEVRTAAQRAEQCAALRLRGEYSDSPADSFLALVGVGASLAKPVLTAEDRNEALQRLRDALEGRDLPDHLPLDVPPEAAAAVAVIEVAGQLAAGDANGSAAALMQALRTHDVSSLINMQHALPVLAAHAAKRGRRDGSASALAPVVRRIAADADMPNGLSSGTLARYATLAGDYKTADELWRRVMDATGSDADWGELEDEYGRYLCNRAVTAFLEGNRALALKRLRTAAAYVPEAAGGVVEQLELDESVNTLLRTLFPGSPILDEPRPGRYVRLAEIIASNPDLRAALDEGDNELIVKAWRPSCRMAGRDIELWHTMAVLSREDALARPAEHEAALQTRISSTALWMLLLAEPAFPRLYEGRPVATEAGERLRKALIEELLVTQKALLAQAVARGDVDTARTHARCLDGIRQGLATTRGLLANGFKEVGAHIGEKGAFAPIARRAEALLEEWGAERIDSAERLLKDPVAIRKLPTGFDADYQTAIKDLEVVLQVGVALKNALRTGLDWHNEWSGCLLDIQQDHQFDVVFRSAERFAEVLIPLSTPGRAYSPENKTLSDYFIFRSVLNMETAPEVSLRDLERAREWDPSVEEIDEMIEAAQLSVGIKLLETDDIDGAERIMARVPEGLSVLATELNNRGIEKLDEADRTLNLYLRRHVPLDREAVTSLMVPLLAAERMLTRAERLEPRDPQIRANLNDLYRRLDSLRSMWPV